MIEIESKPSFGRPLVYFKDEKMGMAYALLTGRKTLTPDARHALEELGVQFMEVSA